MGGTIVSAFVVVVLIAPKPLNWLGVVIVTVLLSVLVLVDRGIGRVVRRRLGPRWFACTHTSKTPQARCR